MSMSIVQRKPLLPINNAMGAVLLMVCFTGHAEEQGALRKPTSLTHTSQVERQLENTASVKATGFVFNNTTVISIPNIGNASLFPSVINVSGITNNAITKATIQLNGFSHSFPDDVDIILEAPDGTRSIVMSDAGGNNGISAPGINLSFSSTGTNQVQDIALLSAAASMRPGNYQLGQTAGDETDTFSGAGNPGALRFSPADFDAFVGINPNGNWKLFVTDDTSGDFGAIAGGWTLVLTVPDIFIVNKTLDSNDGVCDADCSLREALVAAAALPGNNELIRFATPLFDSPQTITLTLGQLVASESVVIQGPGAAKLTISGNDASRILRVDSGAAVALSGMTLTRGSDTSGAGVYVEFSQLYLRQMSLERNHSTGNGGAIRIAQSRANIVGSTISDNRSESFGGVIEFDKFEPGPTFLRIANSTISGNRAGNAGGISVYNSSDTDDAIIDLINNTIVNNQALGSGGIGFFSDVAASTNRANLRNNIIANNSPSNIDVFQGSGSTISLVTQGFNLTNDAALQAPYYNTLLGDQLNADPKLGPLNNNGGQVETHALLHGSNALDQGQASGYERDVRGVARVINSVGTVTPNSDLSDIGALEMNALIVSKIADTNDGFCDFDCSLREAITVANSNPDQSDIVFSNNIFGLAPQTINLTSALPDITNSLSINGPGANRLNVRRNTGGDYRILNSTNGASELAISGITISNGLGNGGGVLSFSRLSMSGMSIENNTDNGGFGGGGVQMDFASGRIKDSSIINNNSSASAGGVWFQTFNQRLQIINTTVSGNQAVLNGGGIYAINSDGGIGNVEISNSTVVNNTAPVNGGLVAITQANPASSLRVALRNTLIANNTSPNLATGIAGGPITITSLGFNLTNDNSTLYLNQSTDKINTNPQLAPLADNGGPTRTHAPLSNSPAIDAGGFGGNRDQIGNARSIDVAGVANALGGDGSDIGAVELPILFRDGFE